MGPRSLGEGIRFPGAYDQPMPGVPTVEAAEWESWVESNEGIVLDVRQPQEWELGTLPGAVLIPMTELVDRLDELPRDKPILSVCRSGNRSERVTAFLEASGFVGAANMAGGMKALGMQE